MGLASSRTVCLSALALVAHGCTCPPITGMVVWDPGDRASDEQVFEIYDTFQEFEAWTGVGTVCSPGVKIHPLLGAGGRTSLAGGWLHLDPSYLPQAGLATRHELCHAWDIEQGFVSLDHPDIFDGSGVEPSALYPTDRLRRMESFALACDSGWSDRGLALGVDEVCDLGLVGDARRFVLEEVYGQAETSWPYRGEAAIGIERRAFHTPYISTMAASGGELFVYRLERMERPDIGGWAASPPDDGEDPVLQYGTNWVERVDPWSGRVVSRIRIPTDVWDPSGWSLLDGEPEPLLVRVADEETRAWRVGADDTLHEVPFPPIPSIYQLDEGVVRGDTAWLHYHDGDAWGLRAIDLEHGSVALVPGGHHPLWIQDLGDALLLREDQGDERWLVWLETDTGASSRMSLGADGLVQVAQALPDGRLLALLQFTDPSSGDELTVPALLDPSEGGWRMDPSACGAGRLERPLDDSVTMHPRLLLADGEAWLFEELRGRSDSKASLTRIIIPPR